MGAALEQTKKDIDEGDFSPVTGERLVAAQLTAVIWSYLGAVEMLAGTAPRQARTVDMPALSYGFLHTRVSPEYRYGIVQRANFPGALMDIGHLRRISLETDGNLKRWIDYNRVRGQYASALERSIPESLFASEGNDTEGASAITLLAAAGQAGQRVYTLTQQNQAQLTNVHHSSAVMDGVRAALAAGKEVTIHEAPVTAAGFSGAGYIVIDPETGAGSYLIEGGANGGFTKQTDKSLGFLAVFFEVLGVAGHNSVLHALGQRFALYSVLTKAAQITAACDDVDDAQYIIMRYYISVLLNLAIVAAVAFFLPLSFFWAFTLIYFLHSIADRVTNQYLRIRGCRPLE